MVESRSTRASPLAPAPGPGQPRHPVQLTACAGKSKVWRAATTQPAVLPARRRSQRRHQSRNLIARIGSARRIAQFRCRSTSWGRGGGRVAGRSRHWPPGGWSSKVIWIRSGWIAQRSWVLLVLGSVCCYKTIIPEAQEHCLVSSGPRYTPSFGGFGLRQRERQ